MNNAIKVSYGNEYDLAGNLRHTVSTFPNIAHPQNASPPVHEWYTYDSMNRMTLAKGTLSASGVIERGYTGVSLTYDVAGRRRSATQLVALQGPGEIWVEDPSTGGGPPTLPDPNDPEPGGDWVPAMVGYMGDRREDYEYRSDGYLMNVYFADEGSTYHGSGYTDRNGVMAAPVLRGTNARDAMGRVTQYQELTDGQISYNRYNIAYDGASRVTSEALSQKKQENSAWFTYTTTTTNNYYGPGGALSSSNASSHKSGYNVNQTTNSSTSYSYAIWDEARVSSSTYDSDTGASNPLWTSNYYYDGAGRLASVAIDDDRDRTVSFASNPNGQVLSRIERSAATNNPADYYYFLDGAQVGELTNNGNHDPTRDTYSGTFVTRNWNFMTNVPPQPFRWNTGNGITGAQFGGSGYDPISPSSQGMKGTDSRYTVRDGDTLQGIAASVWGDASLWYMLAEANGLSGSEALAAGTSLIVPDKIVNIHNSSKTFEVYDPNRAIGDLSPTSAKPPKKANKCGMLGTIMLVAVAIAVSALTAGALSGAMSPILIGALSGAAGSIASQTFGVITGLQDKFSWKGVALAALGGAVGGGLSGVIKGGGILAGAARGAVGSALTQGVGVAVGLQKKFNFAAVAAAGVGGAVGALVGDKLGAVSLAESNSLSNHFANAGAGAAALIASAATRSLVEGSDFGDNLIAGLPDIIGSTLGNMLAFGVSGTGGSTAYDGDGKTEAFEGGSMAAPGVTEAGASDPLLGAEGGPVGKNDIVVTGNSSAAQQAVLSPQTINDPQLRALVTDYKRYNHLRLEERYEDARGELINARETLQQRDAAVKAAQATLATGQANAAPNLVDLQRAADRAQRDFVRAQARVAERLQTFTQRYTAFQPAFQAQRALEQFFIGKTIKTNGGTGTYTIRGPTGGAGTPFTSVDDAAVDGIALATAVSVVTDGRERAGFIRSLGNNQYSYSYGYRLGDPATPGTRVPRGLMTGQEAELNLDPVPQGTVAMFHIHPVSSGMDFNGNMYFGPKDVPAARLVAQAAGSPVSSYIGASDGAIRAVHNLGPSGPSSVSQSAYQIVRPSGFLELKN